MPVCVLFSVEIRVATVQSAKTLPLKDAYEGRFHVGVAINRTIALGTAVRADNGDRTLAPLLFGQGRGCMRKSLN